ncbi:MAG TPA: hypothetical protein VF278_04535 [Pirellulales bacterium]
MTEHQRLFLVQARSDFVVFEWLQKQQRNGELPASHALHYLQMATELLGKSHGWRHGPQAMSHRAFVPFLLSLSTNRDAQKRLGFKGHNANWEQLIRKSSALAEQIQNLAPTLAQNGPNPEYPWPPAAPAHAPVEHRFELWDDLETTAAGRQFLNLITRLFANAEAFL